MRVSQRTGMPCRRRRYAISVPTSIAIGSGVTTRKRNHGGVIASRLRAAAKKRKTSSGGPGSDCSRVNKCARMQGVRMQFAGGSLRLTGSDTEKTRDALRRPTGGAQKEHTYMSDAVTRVAVEIAGKEISFETGKMAKQASGSVVVQAGETMVLGTATAGNLRDVDFLPLTVDIEERMYAAGKIPGSFFKREGRAGEKGTLTARLIDRPIRPLFPKGWRYETQLVSTPMCIDHVHPYDILAMNGASAALAVSDIPFPTQVGAVRIGKVEGNFVVNPSEADLAEGKSDLDLVVAGTEEAILMVEAGANEVPEAEILDALDI